MSTVGLFSKRDWETQSERIPGLINIARIAILFSLLVIQIAGNYADSDGPLAIFPPAEFYSWAAVYGVLILVTVLKPEWQRQTLDLPNANAVADITMMMILTYMAGGIDSLASQVTYFNQNFLTRAEQIENERRLALEVEEFEGGIQG